MKKFLGMDKFTLADDPNVKTLSVKEESEYNICDMTMEPEPGITMPFFLLTPKDADKDLCNSPVVIVPHGHGSDGRYGPAGIFRHEEMEKKQLKYNHDLGLHFVRRGYVVLCPDARGAGDRRNPEDQGLEIDKLLASSCTNLNNAFISLGTSLAAAWCWDLISLIDLVIQMKWGDPHRINLREVGRAQVKVPIYNILWY